MSLLPKLYENIAMALLVRLAVTPQPAAGQAAQLVFEAWAPADMAVIKSQSCLQSKPPHRERITPPLRSEGAGSSTDVEITPFPRTSINWWASLRASQTRAAKSGWAPSSRMMFDSWDALPTGSAILQPEVAPMLPFRAVLPVALALIEGWAQSDATGEGADAQLRAA